MIPAPCANTSSMLDAIVCASSTSPETSKTRQISVDPCPGPNTDDWQSGSLSPAIVIWSMLGNPGLKFSD